MARADFLYQAYQAELITEDEIRKLAHQALAKITTGGGEVKQLSGWGIAGKNFNFLSDLTPSDLVDACTFALKRINGKSASIAYVRFSGL